MEAAERAVRLNPNMPAWALGSYRYASFMVRRYEEALSFQERRPKQSNGMSDYVFRAIALAALERQDQARVAVAETLTRFPDLSI